MTCPETVGPVWKLSGEICTCILPAYHVFTIDTDAHQCSCGTWWYDEQQIDQASTRQVTE